jgi:hypothetical protein
VRKKLPARLRRSQTLLDLAKSKADDIRIRWRSVDLGNWDVVKPRWSILRGRIRFQFCFEGRVLDSWVVSVQLRNGGVRVSLTDSRSPLPDVFEMSWQESASSRPNSPQLWKTVKNWLNARFPGHRIVHASRRADRSLTISGQFLRVRFRHGGKDHLLIAADSSSGDDVRHAAGQALLWLSICAPVKANASAPVVHLFVPAGMSATLFHRCSLFDKSKVKMEVWEYHEDRVEDPVVYRAAAPPAPEEDKDFRWPVLGPFRWSGQFERVLDLAPDLIRRYPRFRDYDSLRLHGLEFAQVAGPERDRVLFGIGPQRTELTDQNMDILRALVEEILFFRRPDSPDTRHPFYRLQAERWLEALVLEDVAHLFPEMAPEAVYSQIPVYLGEDSGRVDILGADRQGILVVMELKVAADPDLPIQALDYRGRVIQHNENGDFVRRGYFSEVLLSGQPPKVYLVSPVFSFHDTTERLLRFLPPGVEVWKIYVNEDWRRGVKILRRIRCNEIAQSRGRLRRSLIPSGR